MGVFLLMMTKTEIVSISLLQTHKYNSICSVFLHLLVKGLNLHEVIHKLCGCTCR